MGNEFAIKVEHVSKRFLIGRQKEVSLRATLSNLFSKQKQNSQEFWALNDVSFEINQGDVVGIIGKNGAGKSTLLKILSEITKPTHGRIEINGRIAALLEVGTGFHPDLTGRENVFLNGTILGMTRKEVRAKFDEIVGFSGVEKFIDTPVKYYSSGMYVRLAFAVAAHLEPEILVIDEVLAVGDAEFQKKCLGKMKDVATNGRTVLFVSHHLGSIRQLCNKGILLDSGRLTKVGEINNVIKAYQKTSIGSLKYINSDPEKEYYISEAYIISEVSEFYNTDSVEFYFKIANNILLNENKFLLLRIIDELDQVIASTETKLMDGKKEYIFNLPENILVKGRYKLNCIIYQPAVSQYDNVSDCCHFEILDNNKQFSHLETFDIGKLYIPQNWS